MGTRHVGPPEEVRALDTLIKLSRAATAVSSRLHRPLEASEGLTESQLGVLEALHHLGPMSQRALGEKLLRSPSNVTLVLENLERRGLIGRQPDPSDRRCRVVTLTDAGRTLIDRVFPAHVCRLVQLMETLTADEQEQLGRLLRKLGRG